jgi:hypothetical protein
MGFRILSPSEAGSWREENMPLAQRGVSLHWLYEFVSLLQGSINEPRWVAIEQGKRAREHNEARRRGRHDMPDMETPELPPNHFLNTHALVSRFIAPSTTTLRAPLFALVPPENRGSPTAFISHTWNSLLIGPERQRIGTLDAVFGEEDEFVWIDFACYNQHVYEDISGDMLDVINTIGKLVVAVTPTPVYNRSWCLWELYGADAIGFTPELRVYHGYRNDKVQSVNALYRSFSGIESARSTKPEDERSILSAFIARHGSVEKANAAINAMLERQLGSGWHELQSRHEPLKFSPGPWIADPQGDTLRAYDAYWEPGLMDSLVYGGKETIRELFARASVNIGAHESDLLSLQKDNPAYLRFIEALKNEDIDSIVKFGSVVDENHPLPFRAILSYEVAPPLHFLMPWANLFTLQVLVGLGANVDLPWCYHPSETKSIDATKREQLVRALLLGRGEPQQASWTPLMLAVQRGDASVCTWLIEKWPKVGFSCPRTGLAALHVAAAARRPDLVKLLSDHINAGPVDAALVSGITALHISAKNGDVATIRLLLNYGTDKDLRDRTGRSALDWARLGEHTAAAELLAKDNAEIANLQMLAKFDDTLRMVLDIFKHFGTQPGEVLMPGDFIDVALRKGLSEADIGLGISVGRQRGFFESGPNRSIKLTDTGFAAI